MITANYSKKIRLIIVVVNQRGWSSLSTVE